MPQELTPLDRHRAARQNQSALARLGGVEGEGDLNLLMTAKWALVVRFVDGYVRHLGQCVVEGALWRILGEPLAERQSFRRTALSRPRRLKITVTDGGQVQSRVY